MTGHRAPTLISLFVAFLIAAPLRANEPFHYPEAKHDKGELRYVNGLPILLVQGSPAEMGEQVGVLALKPALSLSKLADEFVRSQGWERVYPILLKTGNVMLPQFPPDHLKELEAAARASGWSRDLLVFVNTLPDLRKLGGCSTLVVEAARSATGGPLFGRNLDWPPFGQAHEYTLVTVYRPTGKRAFASITYPAMMGCFTGINDAGLALADLTVTSAKDASVKFDPAGTPYTLALRRVLEECTTVEQAEQLLRALKRTTLQNVAIGDRKQAVVFEITPKSIVVRPSTDGLCVCTNHFRTKELATSTECGRYAILDKSRELKKLSVAEVARQMDAVHQGAWTLQTMVIELSPLKLHLAFGKGPATRLPLRTVELAELFASRPDPRKDR
jgi:isopenicillin-N N-acyltransferase like protein